MFPNPADSDGNTALFYASRGAHLPCIALLVVGIPIQIVLLYNYVSDAIIILVNFCFYQEKGADCSVANKVTQPIISFDKD